MRAGDDDRYQHRFHAGNVGDCWKHAVLAALVQLLQSRHAALHVLESHAGAGRYPLGETGEWSAGIGRLWGQRAGLEPWLDLLARAGASHLPPRRYPGSPLQLAALLRPQDRADFFELDPQAAAALQAALLADERLRVHHADGLAGALTLLSAAPAPDAPSARLLVIDPPFSAKEEWRAIPAAMARLAAAAPDLCQLLWYPIKSLTRPNALLLALRELGRPLLALDLLTTPLELQRNRLNGSGLALLQAPAGLAERAAGIAPPIGAACATHDGHWSLRLQAWNG